MGEENPRRRVEECMRNEMCARRKTVVAVRRLRVWPKSLFIDDGEGAPTVHNGLPKILEELISQRSKLDFIRIKTKGIEE
jgi:hypothetical protein